MSKTVYFFCAQHPRNNNKMSLKSNSKCVTIQADALDQFAWSNALRQYAGVVPYYPITRSASILTHKPGGVKTRRGMYAGCTVLIKRFHIYELYNMLTYCHPILHSSTCTVLIKIFHIYELTKELTQIHYCTTLRRRKT